MRASPASRALGSLVSERDWQRQLCELAEMMGFRWIHHRPGLRQSGRWSTATSGPGAKGEPDLFLYGRGRHLWIEAKAESGRLSPDQRDTIAAMRENGCEVHVFRPSDLALAAEVLR